MYKVPGSNIASRLIWPYTYISIRNIVTKPNILVNDRPHGPRHNGSRAAPPAQTPVAQKESKREDVSPLQNFQVMGRYKCKGIRGKWTEDNMKLALSAVKRGVMKVYTASKKFDIPRRTLRRYLEENKDKKLALGRKPLLSIDQEKDLTKRILRLCEVGYPLTQRVLRTHVRNTTFCNANNIPIETRGLMIRRDWLRGFLKRNKNISRRKAQNLNPARAQKLNKTVMDYFNKLKKLMIDNDLLNKPERIFNIDEKGCQLKLHKAPQVLAQRGVKRVHLVAAEHGENVTVVSCGNALGQAIPPMLLFKGKRMKPEWLDSLPTGSEVQMTPKGSMNTETFVNWIHHFAKYKLSGPCVLIFDGAKCHLDFSIVEAANKFGIKLFCLPSNTTHELQPMDKSVFRSFEYFWDEEVLKYWSIHEDRKITKQRFGVIFSKVWDKAATPANIKAGFEATGIYPFNPERIPNEAYAPSIPTHNPITSPAPLSSENDENDDTDASESLLTEQHYFLENSDDNIPAPAQCSPDPNDRDENPSLTEHVSGENLLIAERPVSNNNDDTSPQHAQCPSIDGHDNSQPHRGDGNSPLSTQPSDSIVNAGDNDNPLTHLSQSMRDTYIRQESRQIISSKAAESNISFQSMLKTPEKVSSPKVAPRKKAFNSLAQELTKSAFTDKENMPGPSTSRPQKRKQGVSQKAKARGNKGPVSPKKTAPKQPRAKVKSKKLRVDAESWYCFVCDEDRMDDMRQCFECATYVHEECVGLTVNDKEKFVCTKCSED